MCGKFTFGIITAIVVGSAAGMATKCLIDKKDTCRVKKKAKRLINRMERYINDNMSF